jgi:uncharacterized protein (DUF433 family)
VEVMSAVLHPRISIDPAVCHGKPVVRGTRILVANILAALAAGDSRQQIKTDYPPLTDADIEAALDFAGAVTQFETFDYEDPK